MASNKKDETPKEGSTAHQSVPGELDTPGVTGDGPMPMGALGNASSAGGDPDQKSTHVPPVTVESTLPDGSPTYRDAPAKPKKKAAVAAGKFEAVGRVTVLVTDEDGEKRSKTYEPGDSFELDAKQAESLGENIKPAS